MYTVCDIQVSDYGMQTLHSLALTNSIRGAGIAQWWENSIPTNVAQVRFLDLRHQLMWVEFFRWFLSSLLGFFVGFSSFLPSTKANTSKFHEFDWGFRATMKTTGTPVILCYPTKDISDLQIGLRVRDWVRVRVFKLNLCASYNHLSLQCYP